jgi:adenylate cyclase class IV
MITHVKGKTDKCNHAQQLKHENKVPIKYYGNQDTYFSCNKKKLRAYIERLREVWEMT